MALLQRATSGVELENQADCTRDLEEISNEEKSFTAGFEECRALDPLLVDFVEAGVMSGLRGNVQALQLRSTEVKQQVDAYREVLLRWVFICNIWTQVYSLYMFHMCKTLRIVHIFYNYISSINLRCAALWHSFQHEKETVVEQMNESENKMATFTTAKALSAHQAEDKCRRYKVGHGVTKRMMMLSPCALFFHFLNSVY